MTGFASSGAARDHVCRHWLNPGECWGRLTTGLLPAAFDHQSAALRSRARAGDSAALAELDGFWTRAIDAYESAVERHTAAPRSVLRLLRLVHRPFGTGRARERYAVVSAAGFLAAWSRYPVPSELRTALRPLPAAASFPPSVEDFVAGAMDYAARQVAIHGTWRPKREGRRRLVGGR